MPRGRLVAIASLALGALIAPALAHGSFPNWSAPYSSKSGSDCVSSAWVDPVTMVFEGDEAHAPNVARAFGRHLGWGNQSGSAQRLYVKESAVPSYQCKGMDEQRANGCGTCTRTHARLWRIPASSGANKKVAATPHHEDWVWYCGHAVDANGSNGSGFDKGRHAVARGFELNGHSRQNHNWGNTRNFKQCDGDWAGSNGVGVSIGMGHLH